VVVAELDRLPEPASRDQMPDWAIRIIAILYFLIGLA
jgi:hypothetical protein